MIAGMPCVRYHREAWEGKSLCPYAKMNKKSPELTRLINNLQAGTKGENFYPNTARQNRPIIYANYAVMCIITEQLSSTIDDVCFMLRHKNRVM